MLYIRDAREPEERGLCAKRSAEEAESKERGALFLFPVSERE